MHDNEIHQDRSAVPDPTADEAELSLLDDARDAWCWREEDDMSWEQIAAELHCTVTHARKLVDHYAGIIDERARRDQLALFDLLH